MGERRQGAGLAGMVIAAVWARCANWRTVFTPHGVELLLSDTHYYVRFALMQLRAFPHFQRFDPYVNFPGGAHILWPPGHTALVAGAIAWAGTARAEWAAAWLGPAISGVEVAIIAWLSLRWRGARFAVAATLLYALVPAAVVSGALGNADHHVHEVFVLALAALAAGQALETGAVAPAAVAGLALGWGRLLAPTAFAFLLPLALAWPLASWSAAREASWPRRARAGAVAGAVCLPALVTAVLLFGDPKSFEFEQLSWFHPVFALAVFAACAALTRGARRRWMPPAFGAVALGALLCVGPELRRALGQLGGHDAILSAVDESAPLLKDPVWALQLLGVALWGLPLAAFGAWRAFRRGEWFAAPALLAAGAMGLAAALQARFAQPLAGAAAILLPAALPYVVPEVWPAWARRTSRALAFLGAASLLFSLLPQAAESPPDIEVLTRPTLDWMRVHLPAASPDPYGQAEPRWAVAANPLLGNLILLWAERPVVATPLGQVRAHQEGLARNGALLSAANDDEAYRLARASGVRYVLATPSNTLIGGVKFDPRRSLLDRLVDDAAIDARDPEASTAHFRLIHESTELRRRQGYGSYARLFEVVPGATLTGHVSPGQPVLAQLLLRGDRGEKILYAHATVADGAGRFALQVAYPCNPSTPGDAYRLTSGSALLAEASVSEADVQLGLARDLGELSVR
jgi:hypothetical protein